MKLPANPLVHEIGTWVWLAELAVRLGRPVTLGDVPDDEWDAVAGSGVDAVWLMGVWQRSPAGAAVARSDAGMLAGAQAALGDLDPDRDVVGSGYCIRDYTVDAHLGGDAGLAAARAALAVRGVGLVLDFVPNHVAPDHAWVVEHPEWFVHDGDGIAHGRDPYFPPWPDVLQLDTSQPAVRAAAAEVLGSIADRCDAVRCDMAMLMLDDVFTRTWGDRAAGGPSPDGGRGYWPSVLGAVRATHPDVAIWAEAYWDLEPRLVEAGFDACYDKRLYDRLTGRAEAESIREHLGADVGYQAHTVRFVENHDEPRLAATLPPDVARAAAVVALTLPGVALLHEGQEVGRRVRVPVTLGRRPVEAPDADLGEWYGRLLAAIGPAVPGADGMRRGTWRLAEVEGWPDNQSCEHLVAWTWTGATRHVVVVNLSAQRADGRVRLDTSPSPIVLTDGLSGERFLRDGATVGSDGLYVALPPWGAHLLSW